MTIAMIADALNAMPPIYTTAMSDNVFDDRDIEFGEVTGATKAELHKRRANAENALGEKHYLNEIVANILNTRGGFDVRNDRMDKGTGRKHFDADWEPVLQKLIPLPLDTKVAAVPRPVSRGDVMSIASHYESLCCATFGVNTQAIGLTSTGGVMGATAIQSANHVTLETANRWARTFAPALISIFNLIWGDELDEDGSKLTVVFPSMLPADLIERLYLNGVLHHECYTRYLSNLKDLAIILRISLSEGQSNVVQEYPLQ